MTSKAERAELFAELCEQFDDIIERTAPPVILTADNYNTPDDDPGEDGLSDAASVAAINDLFRRGELSGGQPVPGEWFLAEEVEALPYPTREAMKRKISEHSDFPDAPLRDRGVFAYQSKAASYHVAWLIRVFEDETMQADAGAPEDPAQSFRLLVVSLVDGQEGSQS